MVDNFLQLELDPVLDDAFRGAAKASSFLGSRTRIRKDPRKYRITVTASRMWQCWMATLPTNNAIRSSFACFEVPISAEYVPPKIDILKLEDDGRIVLDPVP